MANFFSRTIGRLFGRKPRTPLAPPSIGGNRGIAAGSRAEPNLESYAERVSTGREKIGEEEGGDFLSGGNMIFVNSSNVAGVQYFPEVEKMMVEFIGGGAYLYSNISLAEARSFLQAQSKGGWVWDYLRVRGSRTAHKKPWVKIGQSWRPPKQETAEDKFKREVEKQRRLAKEDIEEIFNS